MARRVRRRAVRAQRLHAPPRERPFVSCVLLRSLVRRRSWRGRRRRQNRNRNRSRSRSRSRSFGGFRCLARHFPLVLLLKLLTEFRHRTHQLVVLLTVRITEETLFSSAAELPMLPSSFCSEELRRTLASRSRSSCSSAVVDPSFCGPRCFAQYFAKYADVMGRQVVRIDEVLRDSDTS